MEKHTLKIALGCLLAAILLAGCDKNEAPQTTGATGLAIPAAQAAGGGPAADPVQLAAPSSHPVAQRSAGDDACLAAVEDAAIRGASDAEIDKISRSKICNY